MTSSLSCSKVTRKLPNVWMGDGGVIVWIDGVSENGNPRCILITENQGTMPQNMWAVVWKCLRGPTSLIQIPPY